MSEWETGGPPRSLHKGTGPANQEEGKDEYVMIVKAGEKVHVMARRRFDIDLRRHFAGEIVDVGANAIRVEGYSFVMESGTKYVRRPELRTRVFSLTDGGNIFNMLPSDTNLDKLVYGPSKEGRLVVTDGEHASLDINEFGPIL